MTTNYLKVDGHPDLIKDSRTGMILNINKDKVDQALKIREKKTQERQELDQLKADVQDIKAMLLKLLENSSNA